MTANPLMNRDSAKPLGDLMQLEAHIAKLNNYRWIADSGKLYFIAKRERADGSIEHFVDRAI